MSDFLQLGVSVANADLRTACVEWPLRVAVGNDITDAFGNSFALEGMREDGESIPEASTTTEYITAYIALKRAEKRRPRKMA